MEKKVRLLSNSYLTGYFIIEEEENEDEVLVKYLNNTGKKMKSTGVNMTLLFNLQ